jgi:hypothetical protein
MHHKLQSNLDHIVGWLGIYDIWHCQNALLLAY